MRKAINTVHRKINSKDDVFRVLLGCTGIAILVTLVWFSYKEYKTKQKIYPDAKVVAVKKDFSYKDELKFTLYLGRKNLFSQQVPNLTLKPVSALTSEELQNMNLSAVQPDRALDGSNSSNIYEDGTTTIQANIVKKYNNSPVMLPIQIVKESRDILEITAYPTSGNLNPGSYLLELVIQDGATTQTIIQDFSWGVLAVNTNKSVYLPDQTARISFGVLNGSGETVCGADLSLVITGPNGNTTTLKTSDRTIAVNPDCKDKSYSIEPDYKALYQTGASGKYTMELQAITANGRYSITDFFEVREQVDFDIERITSTRINPQYTYPVIIRVKAGKDFTGFMEDIVPGNFDTLTNKLTHLNEILQEYDESTASYIDQNFITDNKKIKWEVNFIKGQTYTLSYTYSAPQISPEFYLLGPATVDNFTEVREWQIASDTPSNMILLWDNAVTSAPSDWLCISCETTDPFFGRYIRGNSTYGTQGGDAVHTHSMVPGNTTAANYNAGATGTPAAYYPPLAGHTHAGFTTMTGHTAPNLPDFRYLNVVKYKYGIPSVLPSGIIAMFSGTAPPGWTQQTAYEDSKFLRGGPSTIVGTTGGNSSHTHTVSWTSNAAPAGGTRAKSGVTVYVGAASHTHSCGPTTSASGSIEPPSATVMLAKKDSDGSIPMGIIAMFDATPPAFYWNARSASATDNFYQKLPKPTGTYGTTSPTSTHTHTDLSNVSCGSASASVRLGTAGSTYSESTAGGNQHSHTYSTVSFGSAVDHNPEYTDAIFAQISYEIEAKPRQYHYHWRINNGDETAASSATSGTQDTPYSAYPKESNKRLRIGIGTNGGALLDTQFRLEYQVKSVECVSYGSWEAVGAGTHWSMYNTTNLTDGNSTTDIANATGGVTNFTSSVFKTPNYGVKDTSNTTAANNLTYEDWLELEYSIIASSSATGNDYCFRVTDQGSNAYTVTYSNYAEATVSTSTSTTISGTIYRHDEILAASTANGGPCDGVNSIVSIRVNGGDEATGTCSAANATYSIDYPAEIGMDDVVTIYLTSASKANLVFVSEGTSFTGKNLFLDTVAVTDPAYTSYMHIAHFDDYDNTQNSADMLYNAVDSTEDSITVDNNIEFHVNEGGEVYDPLDGQELVTQGTEGDVHLNDNSIINTYYEDTSIGGDLLIDSGANFTAQGYVNLAQDIIFSGTSPEFSYGDTSISYVFFSGLLSSRIQRTSPLATPIFSVLDLIINKTSGIDYNDNVILDIPDITIGHKLTVTDGEFIQTPSTGTVDFTGVGIGYTAFVDIGINGSWTNEGKNLIFFDVTNPGLVRNNGVWTLNGNGRGCGEADEIIIDSADTVDWLGEGTFNFTDIQVSMFNTRSISGDITAYSSSDDGTSGNWVFVDTCPVILTNFEGIDMEGINVN